MFSALVLLCGSESVFTRERSYNNIMIWHTL